MNLENRTASKQKEDTFKLQKEEQSKGKLDSHTKKIKRPATPPPSPPAAPDSKEVRSKSEVEIISSGRESKTKSTSSLPKGANSFSMPDAGVVKENPSEDSSYENSLDQGSEYEDISNYQEKKSKILIENSQSSKSPKEGPIYATVSKEHIEAKRERKQKQQPQPLVPPKPPRAPPVPKKMFATDQEVKQEPKVVAKNKPIVPPKPKNLGHADQKVNTKPKVVGVILKNPTVPPKSENQDHKLSAQKAVGKAIPKAAAVTMKEGVNREMGSKVKIIRKKFEQNLAKENANVRPAESKTTPAAQADVGIKKKPILSPKVASQSHSFPMEDKRSQISPLTAKSDPKPHASKNPLLTHVNVKQIAARFENHGKK